MADAVSAATMGHTRMSIATGRTAALEPDGCGGDDELAALSPWGLERMLDREGFAVGVVAAAEAEGTLGTLGKGALEPAAEAPEVSTPATEFDPEDDVALKAGGGVAEEGSTSAPMPHLTVCPSDCSVSVAGVLEPSAAAMVNRVVQVTLLVPGAVNW